MVGSFLSFEALLRPGELALRKEDVTLPAGESLESDSPGMVIVIRHPKTRRIYKTQFILVKKPSIISWMRWWIAGHSAGRKLFPIERHRWAARFKMVFLVA